MGTLLTDFRFRRSEAQRELRAKIWKRNKLDNPKQRGGYELREQSAHTKDGTQIIEVQLWKKIDSGATKLSVNFKAEEIKAEEGDSIEELMK